MINKNTVVSDLSVSILFPHETYNLW